MPLKPLYLLPLTLWLVAGCSTKPQPAHEQTSAESLPAAADTIGHTATDNAMTLLSEEPTAGPAHTADVAKEEFIEAVHIEYRNQATLVSRYTQRPNLQGIEQAMAWLVEGLASADNSEEYRIAARENEVQATATVHPIPENPHLSLVMGTITLGSPEANSYFLPLLAQQAEPQAPWNLNVPPLPEAYEHLVMAEDEPFSGEVELAYFYTLDSTGRYLGVLLRTYRTFNNWYEQFGQELLIIDTDSATLVHSPAVSRLVVTSGKELVGEEDGEPYYEYTTQHSGSTLQIDTLETTSGMPHYQFTVVKVADEGGHTGPGEVYRWNPESQKMELQR